MTRQGGCDIRHGGSDVRQGGCDIRWGRWDIRLDGHDIRQGGCNNIIIIIIIIIAFKGAIRDFFYDLLTAPRTVSNTYAQVARAQSCANHVQHI